MCAVRAATAAVESVWPVYLYREGRRATSKLASISIRQVLRAAPAQPCVMARRQSLGTSSVLVTARSGGPRLAEVKVRAFFFCPWT